MSSFEVIGGNKLKGEIIPQGAKNEALQVLSAVLLTAERQAARQRHVCRANAGEI
jgi:UDP-N-acetylglucosamine 1-carboxyvinyltransferase